MIVIALVAYDSSARIKNRDNSSLSGTDSGLKISTNWLYGSVEHNLIHIPADKYRRGTNAIGKGDLGQRAFPEAEQASSLVTYADKMTRKWHFRTD